MKTHFEQPHDKVTVYSSTCPECTEQGPDFVIGELAERWLVGHTSMWHPEVLDRLTKRLVMPRKKTERTSYE